MHIILRNIEAFSRNPWLDVSVGIILMGTGLIEAGESIFEDISSGDIGAHHGVILLGLAHAFKSLPPILAGMMLFADAEQK
jgi:hypothetical protein